MPDVAPLSATYADARAAFIAAASVAGGRNEAFAHPRTGPNGEELAIDVAEVGPADAPHVVMVGSATHGVEGYCGSALQRHWLEHHSAERPDDTRIVLVHALNPFGFAWVRRVNEDNVDLNRNFIDWSSPPPTNPGYGEIADLLVPESWSEDEHARTTGQLLAIAADRGMDHLQQVVSGGQYDHPTGLFYGGAGPVWSHRWLREHAPPLLEAAERVTIIDLHTGLGPWGHGELISHAGAGDPTYDRAVERWPDVRSFHDGDSVSALLTGDWLGIAEELAPSAEVTPVAIEYGTVDLLLVVDALRADAWLHAHGDPTGREAAAIRAQVRAAFADDDPQWIGACWQRFSQVLGAGFAA